MRQVLRAGALGWPRGMGWSGRQEGGSGWGTCKSMADSCQCMAKPTTIKRKKKVWCWRRLLKVPWTAGRSNQSILKEINPEYSLEELLLKLKLQYFDHLMGRTNSSEKTCCWERLRATEDQMVGWCHWLNRHEFEQTQGDRDGQRSLACCSPWGQTQLSDWTTTWHNYLTFAYFV